MSEKATKQASSKDDLDKLLVLEESIASIGLGEVDAEHGVILKDWSAQDFANIYVRFRPHLMSHARKFLRDESQAEEVVQDAFLYLMTALPELDSELGVLRFLKWKTKMLCLDSLRSSTSGMNASLVPLLDDVPEESQLETALERADDAAIIGLALAKLSPRHREALIATLYEEKSHDEVASQLGLGQNAFRQLLFRARASFKVALVGEAEIEGKSISQILAVATRKAANARTALFLAVVTVASLSFLPRIDASEQQLADQPTFNIAVGDTPVAPSARPESEPALSADSSKSDNDSGGAQDPAPSQTLINRGIESESRTSVGDESRAIAPAEVVEDREDFEAQLLREEFNSTLDESMVMSLAARDLEVSRDTSGNLIAHGQSGLSAHFSLDLGSENVVQFVVVNYESEGQVWKAVPGNTLSVLEEVDGNLRLSFAATDFLVGDFSGSYDFVSTTESVFSRSGIKLDLTLTPSGELLDSRVEFLPKT